MAFGSTSRQSAGDGWATIAAMAVEDGSGGHPLVARLTKSGALQRDLADAVHALCAVHGRFVAPFEPRYDRTNSAVPMWLSVATEAFATERAYLARLTAAVGPLPSTPGQAETDAAFAAQRHAFDMLATSHRAGCATGAAIGFIIDWNTFRRVLDAAAARFGIDPPTSALPDEIEVATIAASLGETPAIQRAMAFGAQQVFAQHRGLCDLIEARAGARNNQ